MSKRSRKNSASVKAAVVPERGTVVIDESAYVDLPPPGQERFGTFELDVTGDGGVPYDLSEASHIQIIFKPPGHLLQPNSVPTIDMDAFLVGDGRDGRVRCEIPREVYEGQGTFQFQVNIDMRNGSRIGSGIGEIQAGENPV